MRRNWHLSFAGISWQALAFSTMSFAALTSAHAQTSETCGYEVSSGLQSSSNNGYVAWIDIQNVSGDVGTAFEVLLDTGDSVITQVMTADYQPLAEYQSSDEGYWITEPHWLASKTIKQGSKHRVLLKGEPSFGEFTPYLVSVNGMPCDIEAPELSLSASGSFFTQDDTLVLSSSASDNTAVRKVEFELNGEVIAVDYDAPFELEVSVDSNLNGFYVYKATAYDPSGNVATSEAQRVFVAIDNKFFGTATDSAADYVDVLPYFNQITPENDGKWGSVEAERDVMVWTGLDTAYQFAKDNGLPFKFHTSLWGQQQPAWLEDLSPEEQLEEIREWMSAVAERYPDLTMVEAVNEPLHAPPSYVEALGGSGETGWDWLITAFELAREYFPNAQLILNDYQILILSNFTQDYLNVITVLQDRGLIDAIGLQAHFLERADASAVAANLNTLAATGLPIYISEFDINLENDARHAIVLSELFQVFWEHPSVVGVTHWGHLEGSVWQESAHLINTDGSTRPALDWIVCYLNGNNGCTLPTYVPEGWQGDEYGVGLEAVLYDQGSGVIALGSTLAYTDIGDWILFQDVQFESDWDTFSVNYAKGNTDVGSISIHLDSLDSAPILTVALPPTAGWGSAETIEVALPSVSGTRNVYVQFNDTYGVANLNSISFSKPAPPAINLIPDSSFEGLSVGDTPSWPWHSWIGATLTASDEQAYSGTQSMKVTDRSSTGQYAVYNLTSLVKANTSYAVSAQFLHTNTSADTLRIAAKVECSNPPAGHNTYPWLINQGGVPGGQWTELSAQLVIPDCDIVDVAIIFEGPAAGVDVFVDDVTVTPPGNNLFPNGDFESSLSGWSSWNGTALTTTSDQAYSGSDSLLAADRADTGAYAVYNITDLVSDGNSYSISAQMYLTAAGTGRIAAKIQCATPPAGHNTYPWIINNGAVPATTWTELAGQIVIPADCGLTEALIFFEGTEVGTDVYIDAIELTAN